MKLRRLASIKLPRVKGLSVTIIGSILVAGSYMPMSADAEKKLSQADQIALKQATDACKAEMKDKKIRWSKSRIYINDCLKGALKDHPNIKIREIDPRFEVRG